MISPCLTSYFKWDIDFSWELLLGIRFCVKYVSKQLDGKYGIPPSSLNICYLDVL